MDIKVNIEMMDTTKKLVQNFLNRSLNNLLKDKEWEQFTWEQQQIFLDTTVYSPLLKMYPVNSEFTKLYFKKIISALECLGLDIHDGLYDCLCSAMECNASKNEFCFRHYLINQNLDDIIVMKETKNIVVNGTTGMRTWEAGLMLADWALCNKERFEKRNVIELGAGVGFTGITIAKYCNTKSFVLTDCHTDVLNTINNNIRINFPNLQCDDEIWKAGTIYKDDNMKIGAVMLDWNNLEDIPCEYNPDILIGADIVYDPSILLPLCEVLEKCIQKDKYLEIYIASVIRNKETFLSFKNMLNGMDFQIEDLEHKPVYLQWNESIKRSLLKIYKSVNR